MNHDQITRTLIETLVERYLKEIAEDPARSLRGLVDMGGQFARGRFQKIAFGMMQTMLEKEDSPYYTLAQRAVTNVHHDTLRTFGVNIGFGSWTAGARMIREQEATCGYNIPWAITLYLTDTTLPVKRIFTLVQEGIDCGIFSYLIHSDDVRLLAQLSAGYPDCAFIGFVPSETITPYTAAGLAECHNLALFLQTEGPWQEAAALLRRHRCLFGAWRNYATDSDAREITSGSWIESLEGHGFVSACCIAKQVTGPCAEVSPFLEQARIDQRYPIALISYYRDNLLIDQIISDGPCFLGILPDGSVTTCTTQGEKRTGQNIAASTLRQVLQIHSPRPL